MNFCRRIPARGRLPLGLLGMIGMIVLVESGLAARSRDLTGGGACSWRWAARSARADAPGAEILCFGDSLVKFGVAPRVIESRTGRRACNLAVTGGHPPNSYFLLRRALDAGARPAALVVDADLLQDDPFQVPHVWAEMASPIDVAGMAWDGRRPDFFAHHLLAWALPSARGRAEVRDWIMAAFRGQGPNGRAFYELNQRNWAANRGASILPATNQLSAAGAGAFDIQPAEVPGRWRCHPVNAAYMDRFLGLAAERGIPVFWLYPPHYRMVDRYFDRPNWGALYREFARERQARHPNLTVIDGNHADYDRTTVTDISHLNRRGAVAFSLAVGDILRDRLAAGPASGPRWIELAPFREPPALAPVEDHAESMLAIGKASGVTRR